jgi:hypothetical protein
MPLRSKINHLDWQTLALAIIDVFRRRSMTPFISKNLKELSRRSASGPHADSHPNINPFRSVTFTASHTTAKFLQMFARRFLANRR